MGMITNAQLSGKTAEQKKVISKYFLVSGCLGSLTAMKDADYDNMVDAKVKSLNLKARAISKIGLDESEISEIKPIMFEGYDDSGEYYSKIGSDGHVRTSKYQVTWLFFSATQVYFYTYTFSMTDDSKKENTEEYFYKDITNFSTTTVSVEYNDNKGRKQTQDLSKFAIVVPGDKMYCAIGGSEDVERSIQAMKQKLREKKM